MSDPHVIQVIMVVTENGDRHIVFDSADHMIAAICSPGIVKYQGKPIGSADEPAVKFDDGQEFWFRDGELMKGSYTQGNSKIIIHNGDRWHLKNSIIHNDDGPAYEGADGAEAYYSEGVLHNRGGPAIILADGTKEWFINGKRHRIDGPAVEFASGRRAWFVDGRRLNKTAYENWQRENPQKILPNKTEESNEIGWALPIAGLALAGFVSFLKANSKSKLQERQEIAEVVAK